MPTDRTPTRAELRLRSAMSAAADAGDMQAWLIASTSLQAILERQEPDAAGRADLRSHMLGACEQLRLGWRSRTGRLLVSQNSDSVTGPLLRSPEEGADTAVWLAATTPAPPTGRFYHDRRPRPEHYLPTTGDSDRERQTLWQYCAEAIGLHYVRAWPSR